MRIVVLGGTVFLSQRVAIAAMARGHDVVCLCRGTSGDVPPGAGHIVWDRSRDTAPNELASLHPDAVVDVARSPSHTLRGVNTFGAAHWVYVSTVSVYANDDDPSGPGHGVLRAPIWEDHDLTRNPDAYGGMKVACEQVVTSGAKSHAIVRPGLIGGPGDPTGRFSYWAHRLSRGGEVLAPGSPDDTVQVIDVRDLAAWIVTLCEKRTSGIYDAVGAPMRFADLLQQMAPRASLT